MRASFYQRIGHPITEIAFLQSRSPAFHAHRINIPVLIAMGENDPRVPRTDMEGIEQAMQKTGVPCEYLLFPDEGHTFTKRENRLLFYARAERFFSHYLSGRCEG
jgi:dipeptidyl aminopeptidase/acylaminoacyl peptidase